MFKNFTQIFKDSSHDIMFSGKKKLNLDLKETKLQLKLNFTFTEST